MGTTTLPVPVHFDPTISIARTADAEDAALAIPCGQCSNGGGSELDRTLAVVDSRVVLQPPQLVRHSIAVQWMGFWLRIERVVAVCECFAMTLQSQQLEVVAARPLP